MQSHHLFLDTHIILWLHDALHERFGASARAEINKRELYFSPIVRLELQYLHEIGRIRHGASEILSNLRALLGLSEERELGFAALIDKAMTCSWTRDPFDRSIAAHAACFQAPLMTADNMLLQHYPFAISPNADS